MITQSGSRQQASEYTRTLLRNLVGLMWGFKLKAFLAEFSLVSRVKEVSGYLIGKLEA